MMLVLFGTTIAIWIIGLCSATFWALSDFLSPGHDVESRLIIGIGLNVIVTLGMLIIIWRVYGGLRFAFIEAVWFVTAFFTIYFNRFLPDNWFYKITTNGDDILFYKFFISQIIVGLAAFIFISFQCRK